MRAAGLSLGALLLLSACVDVATVERASAPRAGFAAVTATTRSATGADSVWLQSAAETDAMTQRVHGLVHRKTIGADRAVQVALLNNRSLQAAYADLGLSAAELWEVAIGPVPSINLSLTGLAGDVPRTLEATLLSSVLEAATQKPRTQIAELRFRQAQLAAMERTLALATETRRAWIRAVAAFEASALIGRAQTTADASSELAGELGQTGAMSKADQAREHAFTAELAAERADARLEAQLAKERLIRLMGLSGSATEVFVPDRLTNLPRQVPGRRDIERLALARRVDLASGRLELEIVAREYRLTGQTRMLSDVAIMAGAEVERDGGTTETQPVVEVEFEIPMIDTRRLTARKGELAYLRAANSLAQRAVDARSEARSAHAEVTGKYRIARHWRDSVLPLRRTIDEETLLAYSGMIVSTFELLADAREGLESQLSAARAKRDFWLADTNVNAAIWGGSTSAEAGEEEE